MSDRNIPKVLSVVPQPTDEQRFMSVLIENRAKLGRPPEHFDDDLIATWDKLADLVAEAIKLKPAYRLLFELFCDAYRTYREVDEQLREERYFYHTSSAHMDTMARKHPLFEMRATAQKRLLDLADEFGLSPSSQAKLSSVSFCKEDPAAEFFTS